MLGVWHNRRDGGRGGHMVLAVGYARIEKEIYYITLDSGWHGNPYPYKIIQKGLVPPDQIHSISVSPEHKKSGGYVEISHWFRFEGLDEFLGGMAPWSPPGSTGTSAGAGSGASGGS